MEEYLLHLPNNLENIGLSLSKELLFQKNLCARLSTISLAIQRGKHRGIAKAKLKSFMHRQLSALNEEFVRDRRSIALPLNPSLRVSEIIVDRCRFMSSAK